MRITLILMQTALLLLLAALVVMAGGSLSAMTALSAGGGPAVLGAVFFLAGLILTVLAALTLYVLPLSLAAGVTLFFAVLAGWRPLRWTRFLGIAANLFGIGYCALLYFKADIPFSLIVPLGVFFAVNICFFALLPVRPSLRLTRKATRIAIPVLYLAPSAAIAAAALSAEKLSTSARVFALLIVLAYALPALYNWRAIAVVTGPPTQKTAWKLGISLAVSLLLLVTLFPLGLPLFLGTLLLWLLLETSLLYPTETPLAGSGRDWIARILGRLPAPAAGNVSLSDIAATAMPDERLARADEIVEIPNEKEPHHGNQNNEPKGQTGAAAGED